MRLPYVNGDEIVVLAEKVSQFQRGDILSVKNCYYDAASQRLLVVGKSEDGRIGEVPVHAVAGIDSVIYEVRVAANGELLAQFRTFGAAVDFRKAYASVNSIDVYVCQHKHGFPNSSYIREPRDE